MTRVARRPKAHRSLGRLSAGLCAFLVVNSFAQASENFWCSQYPYDEQHPLAWQRLEKKVQSRMDVFDIQDGYQYIVDRFEKQVANQSPDNPDIATVRKTISVYLQRIHGPGREVPEVWRRNYRIARNMLLYDLGPLGDNDTEQRVVEIPCDAFKDPNPKIYQKSIAYFAYAMRRAGAYHLKLAQAAAAAMVTATYKSYENLLYNGLAMWPWELAINGRFVPDDFTKTAPRRQLIVLRPNVSLALKFDGNEKSEIDYALTLEPIGFVKYRSTDYKKWWGVSALVTVTNDNGTGYGAMFRWNNYTLGLASHDKDDDVLLYIGVDLYKYILGKDGRTNQAQTFLSKYLNKKYINP